MSGDGAATLTRSTTMDRYTVTANGETFTMLANLAEASAQISYELDGEVIGTPYQTADARHNPRAAARLILEGWGEDVDDADLEVR